MTEFNDQSVATRRKGKLGKFWRSYDRLRMWSERIWAVPVFIVALSGAIISLEDYFDEGIVTVDFNTLSRCARGSLFDMKRRTFLPEDVKLKSGARDMYVCDDEALTADKPEFYVEFASKYSGCLLLDEERRELHMRLNSLAVCKDKSNGGTRYLCNGSDAASRCPPSPRFLVSVANDLPTCPDDIFRGGG